MMRPHFLLPLALALVTSATSLAVSFNDDIRPILADRCFACHGPDSAARKADLRLDREETAKAALSEGVIPIVPGKPSESAIIHRLTSRDPDEMMPPPESKLTVTREEIALIGRWIMDGAKWERHWAFIPPQQTQLSSRPDHPWPRNEIDRFVLETLTEHNLKPSPPATRAQLLRRVTFDLTGLPPTIAELDAYLLDNADHAYERAVDRLLAAPAYGERLALEWLDVARYGDTDGLFEDHPRTIYPWRDWLVTAFNENLPYNDFITWQLAGDLLPGASNPQKIATGFLRNNPTSNEGGLIDEDYRIKYLIDRVNTTSTAFLSLTMECAQCHDHKFDPMTQREYYEMAGFFNSLVGRGNTKGATAPTLRILAPDQEKRLAEITLKVGGLDKTLKETPSELTADFEKWLVEIEQPVKWTAPKVISNSRDQGSNAVDEKKTAYQESKVRGRFLRIARAKGSKGFLTLSEVEIYSGGRNIARSGTATQSSIGFKSPPAKAIDGNADGSFGSCSCTNDEPDAWWELDLGTEMPIDHILVFNRNDCCSERLDHVSVSILGKDRKPVLASKIGDAPFRTIHTLNSKAPAPQASREDYELILDLAPLQGKLAALQLSSSQPGLVNSIDAHLLGAKTLPIKLAGNSNLKIGPDHPLQLVSFHAPLELKGNEKLKLTIRGDANLVVHLTTDPSALTRAKLPKERDKRLAHFRTTWPNFAAARKERDALNGEKSKIEKSAVISMIASDEGNPRPTHILMRGEYDKPGEAVAPSAPGSIMPFAESLPKNRLGLAHWMTDPANPLAARVAVNRYWQMLFGAGLVTTSEDFGTQGNRPSHQALLDHLAFGFVESGWNVKDLLRKMVNSSTYRQGSKLSTALAESDPDNRLLARTRRHRLAAEFIRDHALSVSGLLVDKRGGPGVRPYQPSVLFGRNAIGSSGASFNQGSGEDLYRRSLYTYWKRQIPAANMRILGADGRNSCRTRRAHTNTPLQALVLLNDPQFVEAARLLAERCMNEGGATTRERLTYVFRLCTSRRATKRELSILHAEFNDRLEEFKNEPERAKSYLAGGGQMKPDPTLDQTELAAYAAVSSLIFNLDESISKS